MNVTHRLNYMSHNNQDILEIIATLPPLPENYRFLKSEYYRNDDKKGNGMDGEDYNYCIIHLCPILYLVQGRTKLFKDLDLYAIVNTSTGIEAYNVGQNSPDECVVADWNVFEKQESDKQKCSLLERWTDFTLSNYDTRIAVWDNDINTVFEYYHKKRSQSSDQDLF